MSLDSDDVASFVLRNASPVTVEYGRDQSTALAPTVAGRGSFVLDNTSRRFSPRNAASPLYGYLKPSRPVRISRTIGTDLFVSDTLIVSDSLIISEVVSYVLFDGHTDDNPINPDVDSKSAAVSLVDNLADFRGLNVTTPLYSGIRTGQAIGYILDAAGWSAELRDLDAGATVIPWFWVDNKDALTAMEEALRSEGPPAMLTVGVDGSIIFKDRHHRLIDAASLTSQATWRSSGAEPVMNKPFSYDEAWRNIINTGTVDVDIRQGTDPQPIWTSDTVLTFSPGEQRIMTASTTDPFSDAIVPEVDVDYTLQSGDVTIAVIQASGSSVTLQITAGGGGAIIQDLQLRATPLPVAYSVQVSASDAGSIEDYGPRSFPGDLPWCNQYDAEAVLGAAVAQRAQPNPILDVRFMIGRSEYRSNAILSRDLSDRVTVIENETVINDDFYIESIRHDFTGEHDHSVTFGLEMVPSSAAVGAEVEFEFDNDDAGFDEGVFSTGISLAGTMFTFDDDATSFDIGGFAL